MIDDDREELLGLSILAEQEPFVERLAETLATSALERDNHVIIAGDAVIGFFQIDHDSGDQLVQGDMELHEVLIDARYQGRGLGRAFMENLPDYLRENYPRRHSVCLTVNCRNRKAYEIYNRAGFVDTEELWQEGRSGPQHIMRMAL